MGQTANRRPRDPVLVIDDHEATREAIERLLRFDGYSVVKARDGREALEQLADGSAVFAIVLDLDMPGMDARSFRERQMVETALADIPVIVFTGTMGDPLLGIVGAVRKTDPGALLALLGGCVQGRRQSSTSSAGQRSNRARSEVYERTTDDHRDPEADEDRGGNRRDHRANDPP
jgi:CheY-like chemotaxis protein